MKHTLPCKCMPRIVSGMLCLEDSPRKTNTGHLVMGSLFDSLSCRILLFDLPIKKKNLCSVASYYRGRVCVLNKGQWSRII